MLNKEGLFVDHWGKGASVPDSFPAIETQMFFISWLVNTWKLGLKIIFWTSRVNGNAR